MKKVLILMLVIGLAASANAVMTGSITKPVNESTSSVSITIAGATTDCYLAIGIMQGTAGSVGTLGSFADATAAGDVSGELVASFVDAEITGYGTGEIWGFSDMDTPYVYPDGTWLSASPSNAVAGNVISAYTLDGETMLLTLIDSVIVVPEPMTIALLGLGGLFLRRRK